MVALRRARHSQRIGSYRLVVTAKRYRPESKPFRVVLNVAGAGLQIQG